MKKFMFALLIGSMLLATAAVANGPDPVPGCKPGSKVCGGSGGGVVLGNGPDPVPACKKGSPQCP